MAGHPLSLQFPSLLCSNPSISALFTKFLCQIATIKNRKLKGKENGEKLNGSESIKMKKNKMKNMKRLSGRGLSLEAFVNAKSKSDFYNPALSPSEVGFKDLSVVRYATCVKGTLSRGKLAGVEGMKTKVLVWVKVTSVAVERYKSDKVWFTPMAMAMAKGL